jgi:hypothetical protein
MLYRPELTAHRGGRPNAQLLQAMTVLGSPSVGFNERDGWPRNRIAANPQVMRAGGAEFSIPIDEFRWLRTTRVVGSALGMSSVIAIRGRLVVGRAKLMNRL